MYFASFLYLQPQIWNSIDKYLPEWRVFFYGSYSEEWYSPFAAGVSCSTWLFCHATPPVYQLSLSLGLVVLISVLPLPTFFHSPHLWICNFSQVKSMWQQHFNLPAQNILHRGRRGFVTQEKWWLNGATRTNEIVDRGPNSVAQENWTTVNVEPCLSWGYLQTFLCYAFHSMPFIENITINAPSWLNNSVGTCMIIHLTGHILFGWSSHKTKTSFWKAETGYPTLLNSEPIETQFWGQEGVWKHAS